MKRAAFEDLRRFPTTSWAIWDSQGDSSVDFFRRQLKCLHGRAVIVGLNRSEGWQGDLADTMANFHTPGNVSDSRLKRHIQDAGLTNVIGCFMTDVSDEIKSDSSGVKFDPQQAASELIWKIRRVDRQKARFVICLGDKAFNGLRKGLGIANRAAPHDNTSQLREFQATVHGEQWFVFRVWHSANYGANIYQSEVELCSQLRTIDDRMSRV